MGYSKKTVCKNVEWDGLLGKFKLSIEGAVVKGKPRPYGMGVLRHAERGGHVGGIMDQNSGR